MSNAEIIEAQPRALAEAPQTLAANSPMGMMLAAMRQGVSPDQIREMMALQQQWDAIQAKKAYDAAFAAFKAEAVTIIKGRNVTDGPLKGKRYAELHNVVNAVTPALSKHGLSSSWKLTRDEKDWMEVTCYLRHVGGHEESVSMGGPPDAGGAKNAIQARASTMTYLERYTLKAITGLSEQDDDTDGSADVHADWLAAIEAAADLEELGQIRTDGEEAYTKARNVKGYREFMRAVADRSKALKGKANA